MSKTIWITGETGAIGSALTQELAAQDCRLILSNRNEENLLNLATKINGETLVVPGDLSAAGTAEVILKTAQQLNFIPTGFTHCVGSTLIRPLHLTTAHDCEGI